MSMFLDNIRAFFFYATPHLGIEGIEAPAENESTLLKWMRLLNSDSTEITAFKAPWSQGALHFSQRALYPLFLPIAFNRTEAGSPEFHAQHKGALSLKRLLRSSSGWISSRPSKFPSMLFFQVCTVAGSLAHTFCRTEIEFVASVSRHCLRSVCIFCQQLKEFLLWCQIRHSMGPSEQELDRDLLISGVETSGANGSLK
ncbi:hypothetical protein R1flu_003581 [Riccia fluitans]|uniref:Uncharacterized protein n=1 Tax=Riccia fluitans TaxID=41844 RepID=A0ABD1Y9E7_9MARC